MITPDEAARLSERLPEGVEPADADVLVARASDALRMRSPKNAEAILEGAVLLDPDCGPAWALLGVTRQQLGEGAGAIEALERAIAVDASDVVSIISLCELYVEEGAPSRARSLLNWLLLTVEDAPKIRARAEILKRRLEGVTE